MAAFVWVRVWVFVCVCYVNMCLEVWVYSIGTLCFICKLGESIDTGFHADIFAAIRCACLCVCAPNIYLVTALFTIRSHSPHKHTPRTHSIPGAQTYTISEYTKHTHNPNTPMNQYAAKSRSLFCSQNCRTLSTQSLGYTSDYPYLIHNFQCAVCV